MLPIKGKKEICFIKTIYVLPKKSFSKEYVGNLQRQDKIHIALCSHSYFLACVAERIFAKKNWKCEFCNRAGRNLVIYEIVSLREQNHHLKYTKQSPKTVLIEEYLLQNCNRRQNKFAPTHQDCERWAFIPKNASELNILYSPAVKSLPIIFRDPGEVF